MTQERQARGYGSLLRRKDFAPLWLASIACTASEIIIGVTVTWGTWESTGSATAVGLLISAISLPRILLETLVGRLVDAVDRRRLMVFGAAGACILSIAVLIIDRANMGNRLVATISLVWMLPAFTMVFSRARSSLLPRLISDQTTLISAQALLKTTTEGMSVLSGAAAVLIPIVGRTNIMAAGAALALVAGIAACRLPSVDETRAGLRSLRLSRPLEVSIREPFKAIAGHPFLVWFVGVVAISNIPHNALMAMLVPLSAQKLRLGAQGYGIVEVAVSAGVIAGYLAAGRLLSSRNPVRWAIGGLLWSGIMAAAISLASGRPLIAALFVGYGLSEGFFLPAYAKFDLTVDDQVRGRVNALFNVIALLMTPVAQIGAGVLSDAFGPSAVYLWAGLALVTMGILALWVRPAGDTRIARI